MESTTIGDPLSLAAADLRAARAQHGTAVEADRLARNACSQISAEIRDHEANNRWPSAEASKIRSSELIATLSAAEADLAAATSLLAETEAAAERAARDAFKPHLLSLVESVEGLKDALDAHWAVRQRIAAAGIRSRAISRLAVPLPGAAPLITTWPKWVRQQFDLPPRLDVDPAADAAPIEPEPFGDAAIEPATKTATSK